MELLSRRNICLTMAMALTCSLFSLNVLADSPNDPQIQPGQELQLGPEDPNAQDFSERNGILSRYGNAITSQNGNKWVFINGNTSKGSGSFALRYAFDLSEPFSMNYDAMSTSSIAFSPRWSTDFIGAVFTTAAPKKIASSQIVTSAEAGYATKSVDWQQAIGLSPYPGSIWNTAPRNVIRTSIKGTHTQPMLRDAYKASGSGSTIKGNFRVTYEPSTRTLKSVSKGANGTFYATHTVIPEKIETLYVGLLGVINSNSNNDVAGVTVNQLSGTYKREQLKITYNNDKNEQLDAPTIIKGIRGLDLSVAGDEPFNFLPPKFNGYHFVNSDYDVTMGDLTELPLMYDYDTVSVPMYIYDNDDGGKLLDVQLMAVKPYKSYLANVNNVFPYLPDNYEAVSINNGHGMAELNKDGDPVVTPIDIYVKHVKVKQDKTFTRTIKFATAKDVEMDKLPDDVVQKVTQSVELDKATNKFKVLSPQKSFDTYAVPEFVGYKSDKETVPSQAITSDTSDETEITVNYDYLIKLSVPDDIDFGAIKLGSPQYYGAKAQNSQEINGELSVENGDRRFKTWSIALTPNSETKSTIFNVNDQQVGIGETKIVYQTNRWKTGKELLLNNQNKNSLSINTFNSYAGMLPSGTEQSYTLNWALQIVPV